MDDEEVHRAYMERIYAAVADVLWQNSAADVLVARMAKALHNADWKYFQPTDFKERAYATARSHP